MNLPSPGDIVSTSTPIVVLLQRLALKHTALDSHCYPFYGYKSGYIGGNHAFTEHYRPVAGQPSDSKDIFLFVPRQRRDLQLPHVRCLQFYAN